MKVIIMGCGLVGAELATLLDSEENQVTILDLDPDSFERLPPTFKGEALIADGTEPEDMERAGIEEADAFIALTEEDNRNILATQMARDIYNVSRVLCRIYDPARSELYEELGLETFSPTRIVAHLLRQRLVG
ncbi:MAG: TrkA family potassium uptake protein [Dehalococcoidia bacterium]|nr:TrkA family potassium uptake protein [Dehalococcoidia bacterium]